jgi:pilus assembly protein CpaF
VNASLLDVVFGHDELAAMDAGERRLALRSLVSAEVDGSEIASTVAHLSDLIDGFGPLTELMRDDSITDVLVNGVAEVWVERSGTLEPAGVSLGDDAELRAFIDRMLGRVGARVDASHPITDARLEDGSRMHVVLPPVAPAGPMLSIRRFPRDRPGLNELVATGMLTDQIAGLLKGGVRARRTMVISGGTGTGKTTLLNALLGCIDANERIVTIEETPELRPDCSHVVSLITRAPNVEGRGTVDMSMLVRAALRMRPDRIVVGEVRGPEALDALAAMSTGHEGSMVTIHARGPRDALDRFVALGLQARSGAPERSVREQVDRAVRLVVHLERTPRGRRVADILEPT